MPVLTLQKEGKTKRRRAPISQNPHQHGISYEGVNKIANCLGNGLCGTCR